MAALTDVRKLMEGAADRLSPSKAQELAKGLMQGQGKEQIQKTAQEILAWSNKNRERVVDLVRKEVTSQLRNMGVASRDDVDALRKRVRELERALGGKKASTAKRPAAKRAAAKPAPATPV